ncbi:hypothetical protein ACF3NA_03300 [Alkanindiges sp. WGS2144]|uniref:hypothetical protein n=1 Tax=Alkanindiges sp. WGS2144 TaxID=3366808 RepID=UPI003752DA7F
MIPIYINSPFIKENTVSFSWSVEEKIDCITNHFYVKYHGINIEEVPIEVHLNTFLSLFLNALGNVEKEYMLIFEEPICEWIGELWLGYFKYNHVKIAQITPSQVRKKRETAISKTETLGILYGGGKDSLFTLSLLSNFFKKISLLSYIIPNSHVTPEVFASRREKLILNKIKDYYDVDIIQIETNARGVFYPNCSLELYMGPVGLLVYLGMFEYITYSFEYSHFFTKLGNKNLISYRRSRNEQINRISSFYRDYLAPEEVEIFNANYYMTELSSFSYLSKTSKNFTNYLVMCESTLDATKKWCLSCTKCAEFVLFSIFNGVKQEDIDVESFFESSPWIVEVIKTIKKNNYKELYFPKLTASYHYDSFRYVLSQIREMSYAFNSNEAKANFEILIGTYGNTMIKNENIYYKDLVAQSVPKNLQNFIVEEISSHIQDGVAPEIKEVGGFIAEYDKSFRLSFNDINSFSATSQDVLGALVNYYKKPQVRSDIYKEDFNFSKGNFKVHSFSDTLIGDRVIVDYGRNWLDLYYDERAPKNNSGIICSINFPSMVKDIIISGWFTNYSLQFTGRFVLTVYVNEKPFSSIKDFSKLANSNGRFFMLINYKDDIASVKFKLQTLYNLEAWNWGRAARLILEFGRAGKVDQNKILPYMLEHEVF